MVILVNDMCPPDGDLARPVPRIIEQSPDAPLRGPYERLIRSKYAQVHGARLEQFMPQLVGCLDGDGQALLDLLLADELRQSLGAERQFDQPLFGEGFGGGNLGAGHGRKYTERGWGWGRATFRPVSRTLR